MLYLVKATYTITLAFVLRWFHEHESWQADVGTLLVLFKELKFSRCVALHSYIL